MIKSIKLALLLTFGVVLLQQCAVRRAPEGGEPDKTPPQVVHTFPNADSTNVRELDYLELRFDENLERSSVRNQIWLLPEPPGGFKLEWKNSKTLRIVIGDSLEKNRTYLLTVGTEVKDQRSNNLEKPILLPFSTGETIDKGEIAGKLYASQPENTYIYVYDLNDAYSDSSIFKSKPAYYSQVSKTGEYRMSYLRPGNYRVFALSDQNRNRLYDRGVDLLGIPQADVVLDSTHLSIAGLDLTLFSEDLMAPAFVRASKVHTHQLRLSFSEPLADSIPVKVVINDSITRQPLQVFGSELDKSDKTRVIVYTAAQKELRYAGEVVGGVQDTSGNKLDTIQFVFSGSTKEDTVKARFIKHVPSAGAGKLPFDTRVSLEVSQPLSKSSLQAAVQLTDKDSLAVAGEWQETGGRFPVFVPAAPLARDGRYELVIDTAKLKSYRDEVLGDSVYTAEFTTWQHDQLGEISGVITVANDSSDVILDVVSFNSKQRLRRKVSPAKPYLLNNIPEGKYRMVVRLDKNGNGKWDAGNSLPFQFADPFFFLPDTIKVRKRWTTEGISFQVK
ncbi:MAG: Ig-like domain-containing protein [Calditrichia bacterium]